MTEGGWWNGFRDGRRLPPHAKPDMISLMQNRRVLFFLPFLMGLITLGCEKLEVTVFRARKGLVESTVTSVEAGVVEPWRKASLAASVSGRIVRVYHEEGDRVSAGEPLVELENDLERLRVEESAKDLDRLRRVRDDLVTQEQLDRADFAYRRAQVDHERTNVRATFAGVVAKTNARLGEMVFGSMALAMGTGRGGSDPLVYLIDDSRLFVEAEIDESDLFRVSLDQPVKVSLGGIERTTLQAKVISISPTVSTQEGESRTAKIKSEIVRSHPHPDGSSLAASGDGPPAQQVPLIRVGMSADIEILVGKAEDVLQIPTTAILERGEDKHVFVVRGSKVFRQPITVGIGNWDMTEVRSGLSEGDLVVLPTDAKLLTEGLDVKFVIGTSRQSAR